MRAHPHPLSPLRLSEPPPCPQAIERRRARRGVGRVNERHSGRATGREQSWCKCHPGKSLERLEFREPPSSAHWFILPPSPFGPPFAKDVPLAQFPTK